MHLNFGDQKGKNFNSTWGCIGTVIVIVITLSYLLINVIAVRGYKGTSVMTNISGDFFEEGTEFGQEDGFALAIGFDEEWWSEYYELTVEWVQ